jgi:DNA invertase Pin-like site-specific DNA recombinase
LTLIGYARVSTQDQKPELQLDALRGAGCVRVFEDRGVSGAKAERPGLAQALAHVREGDTLVIWKLDRLGRSLVHLIETVNDLERRGVGLRSLTEQIDTTTSGGRLIFHVFGALGQFERDLIRERTHTGLATPRPRGGPHAEASGGHWHIWGQLPGILSLYWQPSSHRESSD